MAILAKIGQWIASWLLTKLVVGLKAWAVEQADKKRREAAIKDALKPYLESHTKEEQEDAFQKLLTHMRG